MTALWMSLAMIISFVAVCTIFATLLVAGRRIAEVEISSQQAVDMATERLNSMRLRLQETITLHEMNERDYQLRIQYLESQIENLEFQKVVL